MYSLTDKQIEILKWALEKSKVVEKLDLDNKEVKYSNQIKQYREIKKITWPEELVRAYILEKLSTEFWYDLKNIEIEKEYDIGRPKVNKPRIDIIVRDEKGNAFLYMELKSPDEYEKDKNEIIEKQLFNLASQEVWQWKDVKYLVLYTFDIDEESWKIKHKSMLIDYSAYNSFLDWKETYSYATEIPANYWKATKRLRKKDTEYDLETDFSENTINSLATNLHDVLWWGGSTDDNTIFASLTNLILAKIQDEAERMPQEEYEFQDRYDEIREKDKEKRREQIQKHNEELFDRINGLYRRALRDRLNETDEKKLQKAYVIDEQKFSLSKLAYAVSELESYSFINSKNSTNWKDILGWFFETIVREWFKQTKGQFFTPENIVKFMIWWLQLDKLAIKRINSDWEIPYLIDPSAWSGTFLIEYMKFITKNIKNNPAINQNQKTLLKMKEWFPDYKENHWAKDYIYWIELNFDLWTATKVNMILHWDGSTNIFVKDWLLPFSHYLKAISPNALNQSSLDINSFPTEVNGQFDCIVTNPPFSVTLDKDTSELVKNEFIFWDKKSSENLFIERYYQLLRENGRAWIVLPESVFDTTENKYIRLFIYKYFKVKAVVSLPQLTFEPYTSTKTSILFVQKKTKEEVTEWKEAWNKYSNERSKLKTRCKDELELIDKKEMNKKRAIADEDEETRLGNIRKMLKNYLVEEDNNLTIHDLVVKYKEELKDLCKEDKDTEKEFWFVNTWWVFEEVAKELDYSIFMAEAENVGYKRTKRWEKPMPNDLYRTNWKKEILVDDWLYWTILDELRKIEWE